MSLSEFVESKAYKNVMKFVYGWGASVVLLGALFKIQHWPGSGIMLTLGMSTEVLIFFLSAFEPLHEEVDWTLVYPELAGMTDDFEPVEREDRGRSRRTASHDDRLIDVSNIVSGQERVFYPQGGSGTMEVAEFNSNFGTGIQGLKAIEKLDTILAQADLSPEVFQKLGEGIHKVGDLANKFTHLEQTIEATGDFSKNISSAAISVGNFAVACDKSSETIKDSISNLSNAYNNSSEVLNKAAKQAADMVQDGLRAMVGGLNDASLRLVQSIEMSENELRKTYQVMIDQMNAANQNLKNYSDSYLANVEAQNKNLASINAVYELHVLNISQHTKLIEDLSVKGAKMVENFEHGLEQSAIYKDELKKLNEQLVHLNQIYGSMLSTVTINE